MSNISTSTGYINHDGRSTGYINHDGRLDNETLSLNNWTSISLGCLTWKPSNHVLFQVANAVLCVGLLSPHIKHGVLFLHSTFVFGFLLLSVWAWVVLCAPDYFSWNFAFMVINVIHAFMMLYNIKPVKLDENLERLYQTVFQPMNVSRRLFKKLTDQNFCLSSTLYEGDAYALQGITKTDRLGLLVTGTMKVYSHQNFLHMIREMEFIDSPEFESSVTGDEKFQVSVYAASTCYYIYWPRQSLEYLLMKEPFLATVLNTIMGRDITNKLYALNSRAKYTDQTSSHTGDIPLMIGPSGKIGDLRRTLAQLSKTGLMAGRQQQQGFNNPCLIEEQEDSDVMFSGDEEGELLSPEAKMSFDNHLVSPDASVHSDHSNEGISFTVKDHSRIQFNIPAN